MMEERVSVSSMKRGISATIGANDVFIAARASPRSDVGDEQM